ncbi:hypothetical protein TGMAS_209112 [Toxoplasma gondii MAS]|uniref:mRNA decapping enzyme n=5 Tax=Toxoplasma gondii TaxID=5811 RepID=A0A086QSC0_TOXGO|nr:hypothetical protein TGP89_209112 [Toxoplasma gondii p89]KFH15502.1 hypothetical protein TGMAS_209112 [Toxoplasma gondii MAS]RQX69427.1 putative mRNA decapping enzyme [Toxoplasma gondii CAST]
MGRGDASPSTNTPPVPSSVARARDEISLRCLQRHDARIRRIICQAAFVSVYALCPATRKWERAHIQGGLHVVERDAAPSAPSAERRESRWRLFVLNQRDTGVLLEDIDEAFEMEGEKNHIFYRVTCPTTGQQRIHAIWVYDDKQRLSVQQTLQQIIDECAASRAPLGAPSEDFAPQTRPPVAGVSSASNSAGVQLLALLRGAQGGAQKLGTPGPTHPTQSPVSGSREGSGPTAGQSLMSLLGVGPSASSESSGASPLLPASSLLGSSRPTGEHTSLAGLEPEEARKNTSLSILSLLKRPAPAEAGSETGVSFPGGGDAERPPSRGGLSPRSPRERDSAAEASSTAGTVSLVGMLKRSGENREAPGRSSVSGAGLLGSGLLGAPAPAGPPLLPGGRAVPDALASSPLLAAPLRAFGDRAPLASSLASQENAGGAFRAPAHPLAAPCGAEVTPEAHRVLVSRSMLTEALQRVLKSEAFSSLLWQELVAAEERERRRPRLEESGERRFSREDARG